MSYEVKQYPIVGDVIKLTGKDWLSVYKGKTFIVGDVRLGCGGLPEWAGYSLIDEQGRLESGFTLDVYDQQDWKYISKVSRATKPSKDIIDLPHKVANNNPTSRQPLMNSIIIHDPIVNEFRESELNHYNNALPVVANNVNITGDNLAKALGTSSTSASKVLRAARRTLGIECSNGGRIKTVTDPERFGRISRILNGSTTTQEAQQAVEPSITVKEVSVPKADQTSLRDITRRLVSAINDAGVTQMTQVIDGFTLTITKI